MATIPATAHATLITFNSQAAFNLAAPGLPTETFQNGLVPTGVTVCDIPVATARAAKEMLLIGSSVKVAPIVQWDQQPVGNGRPGPVARMLRELIEDDMRSGDRLIDVPY